MTRKSKAPLPEKPVAWVVYRFVAKLKFVGRIEAPTEAEALENSFAEFKIAPAENGGGFCFAPLLSPSYGETQAVPSQSFTTKAQFRRSAAPLV
jgi:hypothetical protein